MNTGTEKKPAVAPSALTDVLCCIRSTWNAGLFGKVHVVMTTAGISAVIFCFAWIAELIAA
jgi:hypothetical protein